MRSDRARRRPQAVAGIAVLLIAATVAACAPQQITQRELTFATVSPIALDVARVDVVQRYQPSFDDPYVDHLFRQVPADVIRRWAEARLQPAGGAGGATLYIEDASVLEEALARTPGLAGAVTIDQSERYTATFTVRLEVDNPTLGRRGVATVTARRSITVPENATLADRSEVWLTLTEKTVDDLDARLEMEVRSNLPSFVAR